MPRFLLSSNQNRGLEMKMRRHASSCVLRSALQKQRHRWSCCRPPVAFCFRSAQSRCRPSVSQDRHAAVVSFQTASTTTHLLRRFRKEVMDANITTGTKRCIACQLIHNESKTVPSHQPQQASKKGQHVYYYCYWTHQLSSRSSLTHTCDLAALQKCRSNANAFPARFGPLGLDWRFHTKRGCLCLCEIDDHSSS